MALYKNITELVGNTPLVQLSHFAPSANLLAKVEFFNPAGSVKDRAALKMLEDAEKSGKLQPGSIIIEPTSGNTGIGIAAMAAYKGYKVILTMPETMSIERRNLLAAYGAEIVLTEGSKGMNGAVEKAMALSKQYENSFIAGQFDNPANAQAHYETTGPEIWADTEGKVDIFVAGVGTGGTLTGTGKYLKEKNPNIQIVAVEPYDSPLLSEGRAGAHGLQGIGANFVPTLLDRGIYDEIITVKSEEAFQAARNLVQTEGLLVGISSGAALHAAKLLADRPENKGKTIVALLPDTGERYLSTELFKQ